MLNHRVKPIVYSHIEEKNILEKELFKPMTPSESLVHALDMMDLFASMRERPHHPEDDEYPWITLKLKNQK
jgi:hypothetical protein